MRKRRVLAIGFSLFVCISAISLVAQESRTTGDQSNAETLLAPTPPMGWNSYDAYGTTINETQFKANAEVLARKLKPFGWQYAVIDMEWFVTNPTPPGNGKNSQYAMDAYGRYTPALNRFPSAANGAGFAPLAKYVHSLGLKFGIHILSGIPKEAVEKNLPIAGSSFHAADAANRSETCPWNPDNFGLNDNAAGQAYYDSIAHLYAGWGVDFIKADCIASRPYRGDEIRMLSLALRKTGRPIVLSLSPGAAPLDKLDELRQYAQMWRISDDVWDLWHSTVPYPQGLGDQFPRTAKWAPLAELGHWPDSDMLPLGDLGPAPGWGKPRRTRFTHDEQRTLLTLWTIARSPLMLGANLTEMDSWTSSLLTNPEVIAVDQHSSENHQAEDRDGIVLWLAKADLQDTMYVAAFNTTEEKRVAEYPWTKLDLEEAKYEVRDLWRRKNLGRRTSLKITLPPHGCVLYRISPK